MAEALRIQELLDDRGSSLHLELLTTSVSLEGVCSDPYVTSPGLAMVGFVERFPAGRMQVFGQTEMMYLATLSPDAQRECLESFFSLGVPVAFVTKGQEVPDVLLETAAGHDVPVFGTVLTTKDFFRRLKPYLEFALAPSTSIHGSLADVYGVGLLFTGNSGIGKSECVLDLVERGHRVVADDLILVSRRGHDVLIGEGHELQKHHMEIRGVGIIDVKSLFGVRAIRQQKRIEVVVHLQEWGDTRSYDRTGLDPEQCEILEVCLPKVTIPLNPGKNITVISEIVAMNHLLKYSGVDSAEQFDRELQRRMAPVTEYLEEDYE